MQHKSLTAVEFVTHFGVVLLMILNNSEFKSKVLICQSSITKN